MILIDRDKEIEQLKKNVHGVLFANFGANGYGMILVPFEEVEKVIADQPTIEIVQCRECKWWDKEGDSPVGYCHAAKHSYYSGHWEIEIYRTYKEDFFCADGERRSDDDTHIQV